MERERCQFNEASTLNLTLFIFIFLHYSQCIRLKVQQIDNECLSVPHLICMSYHPQSIYSFIDREYSRNTAYACHLISCSILTNLIRLFVDLFCGAPFFRYKYNRKSSAQKRVGGKKVVERSSVLIKMFPVMHTSQRETDILSWCPNLFYSYLSVQNIIIRFLLFIFFFELHETEPFTQLLYKFHDQSIQISRKQTQRRQWWVHKNIFAANAIPHRVSCSFSQR